MWWDEAPSHGWPLNNVETPRGRAQPPIPGGGRKDELSYSNKTESRFVKDRSLTVAARKVEVGRRYC